MLEPEYKETPMPQLYRIPLVLTPQPEGGFTVTSPLLPELVTEGDTAEAAIANVADAVKAVSEIYEDQNKPMPGTVDQGSKDGTITFEYLVSDA